MFPQRALHQFSADDRRARQRDVLPNDILQLTDISGPFRRNEHLDGLRRIHFPFLVGLGGNLLEEKSDQERYVFAALVQRRQPDIYDVKPVVEVLAEAALLHQFRQIAMRRRQNANVDATCLRAADWTNLVLLQNAQQLYLQPHWHITDFIEHQRPAFGRLEQSFMAARSACESAPFS